MWPETGNRHTSFSLRQPEGAYISRAISHADLGLTAVRWPNSIPGLKIQSEGRKGAHGPAADQPENYNVASRLLYAPAIGSWRSLWPSVPSLEPEDGRIHLRC